MISLRPSTIRSNSSVEALPIFFFKRSTESVLIWLIFAKDFLGSLGLSNSSVSGKRARSMGTCLPMAESNLSSSAGTNGL